MAGGWNVSPLIDLDSPRGRELLGLARSKSSVPISIARERSIASKLIKPATQAKPLPKAKVLPFTGTKLAEITARVRARSLRLSQIEAQIL